MGVEGCPKCEALNETAIPDRVRRAWVDYHDDHDLGSPTGDPQTLEDWLALLAYCADRADVYAKVKALDTHPGSYEEWYVLVFDDDENHVYGHDSGGPTSLTDAVVAATDAIEEWREDR